MTMIPRLALSVRQPWAWAIVHGGKRLENRTQAAVKHMTYRGPIAIHASLGMTQLEYWHAAGFMMEKLNLDCPKPHELARGGIIGTARVVDVIKASDSPWFFGPRALVLEDVQPVPFIACKGALGFFDWRKGAIFDGQPEAPKKWMLPRGGSITFAGEGGPITGMETQGKLL
ncbi:ASCH domain-containing protein [Asticcacaulis taihuensis]|uniref:ASCH domain-containing protein n=1 Tax=Asticcacaulis taihuensis TaxID=260084 RepID=UPI0026EF0613|nr:ASCH domain-containing protein [Asticcacaulis taihuensis]